MAAVASIGAITPIGLDAGGSAAAARAGISRVGEHPSIVDASGAPLICGRVPTLEADLPGPDRVAALAAAALREALAGAGEALRVRPPVPIFLALPYARPGFGPSVLQRIVDDTVAGIPPTVPRVEATAVATGHAAGLDALERATRLLESGASETAIVVGADSYLDLATLAWLEGERRIARDGVRGGFPPGEAAAAVVLTRSGGAGSRIRVQGVATGTEPRSRESEEGLLGEGLTDVVRRAAAGLRLPDERVDDVYCDLNGERHRTDEWAFAVLRTWPVFRDGSAYRTHVGEWGDLGAATSIVNCVLATRAFSGGYAAGARALVWGSSDEGLRGAAVICREGI